MKNIVFIHGMFQNAKSWEKWTAYFEAKGYNCTAISWPLHEGEPAALRANPSEKLGELSLNEVIASVQKTIVAQGKPIVIGHSVGGLIAQILANRGLVSKAVAINSVAPNAMLDFDWGFLKNSTIIANPLKGDEPAFMDAKTFHEAFANTLSEADAATVFEMFATHDSRNVLRDCMGPAGHIDLDKTHAPLLLIAGEKDEIIPASLTKKNYEAYPAESGITTFKEFPNRSHYICGEPGWEEVANYVDEWLRQ